MFEHDYLVSEPLFWLFIAVAIAFGVCSAGDVARLSPRAHPSDPSG